MEDYKEALLDILEETFEKVDGASLDYLDIVDEHDSATIDKNARSITFVSTDLVVQGDSNSDAKTFIIPRYYDGIDLSTKTIEFIYQRPDEEGDIVAATDIEVSTSFLRFTWVLGAHVLALSGDVTFCVQFVGSDEFGNPYSFKTIPATLEINESLMGDAVIASNTDWVLTVESRLTNLEANGGSGGTGGSSIDEAEVTELISKYITDNNIGSVSSEDLEQIVANYMAEHPVTDEVSSEDIATAVETYLTENPINEKVSKWNGKKACFLGDSITYGVNTTKTYIEYLNEKIGFSEYVNLGSDGATIVNRENSIITQLSKIPVDTDIIFLFAGTNDWGRAKPLGDFYTYEGTTGKSKRHLNTNNEETAGALIYISKYLYEKFPNAQFVYMTPIHRDYFQYAASTYETNYNGYGYLEDYAESIKKCGQIFSIPVIDLMNLSGLYPTDEYNAYIYFHQQDKLHPNAEGHRKIANVIEKELESIDCFVPNYTKATFGNIVTENDTLEINSGESGTLAVKLDASPSFYEIVEVSCESEKITLSNSSLTFASYNYSTAKNITVTCGTVTEDTTIDIVLSYKYANSITIPVTIKAQTIVENNCTSISLDNSTLTFTDENTKTLIATLTPIDTTDTVVWTTSDDAIATVSNGTVTPKSNGTCTITATCGTQTATCNITVNVESEIDVSNYASNTTYSLPKTKGNPLNVIVTTINKEIASGTKLLIDFDYDVTANASARFRVRLGTYTMLKQFADETTNEIGHASLEFTTTTDATAGTTAIDFYATTAEIYVTNISIVEAE